MRRRGRVVVMTALVLLSLAVPRLTVVPIDAQAVPVELKYALRPGDVIYYQVVRTLQQTTEIGAQRQVEEGRMDAREAHRVLDVDARGNMVVELTFEDLRFTVGGQTESRIDTPLVLRSQPDGRVAEIVAGDEHPDVYLLALPKGPVAIGESWSKQVAEGTVKATTTFTLDRVDQIGGERIAVIRTRDDGSIAPITAGAPPAGVTLTMARTTLRGSGEILWSVDRGRIVRTNNEFTVDMQIELATADQTLRMRRVIKGTERREPLTADLIPVSATAQDQLIVPGKGAGPWTLDLPVSGLTTRYGAPTDRGVRSGFRARTLAWEAGPTGLLDPADADRLVGLEMSGQTYRTDKGIGFGSSEGAVLLAYGMTPTKFELAVPGPGATRFLIYNDQGIAFAINLDKSPSSRAAHAPAGTVDWMVVFMPGDAGKIFELP